MRNSRLSLASVPRGAFLAAVGAWSVLLHVLHLVLIHVTATPVHHLPIVASTLSWAGITAWGLVRGARLSSTELVVAIGSGAVAITVDGVWGGAPGHAYLVSAGLVVLVVAITSFGQGRAALVGSVVVLACQVGLLLSALGTGPLGVYVAAFTTTTTGAVGFVIMWQQRDLMALVASTQEAAAHDPLTGLLNRRGMAERFPALRSATPAGHRVAAVVLDLDHFKRVNDTHGHDAGDKVLVHVARVLRGRARQGDLVVRLGGEELAWLGSWPSARRALDAADELRRTIAAGPTPARLTVTVSTGVAFATTATQEAPDGEALSRLLVRADAALYEAKSAGRDRVVLAAQQMPDGAEPHDDGAPALQVQDGGSSAGSAVRAAPPGAGQRA